MTCSRRFPYSMGVSMPSAVAALGVVEDLEVLEDRICQAGVARRADTSLTGCQVEQQGGVEVAQAVRGRVPEAAGADGLAKR